ncbi:MAG: tetratricopeptide repeat protein [Deferribacteres bacterium]|nr:tetratricopeptide repeat protein [Deferribacteres bacterium]
MRKRLLLCLLILLTALLVLSFTSVSATRNKNIPKVALVIPSKHEEAAEKATAGGPEDADIYYNLGVALGNEGKFKEAAEAYEKAVRIRPDFAEAYYNLGFAYDELGMYWPATEAYRQAAMLRPGDADIYYNLGVALGKAGKYKEAVEAYEKAISIRPDYAEAHYNQGFAYNELGMYKEAEHAFRQAVRIKPAFADSPSPVNEDMKDATAAGEISEPEKATPAPLTEETATAEKITTAGEEISVVTPQKHSKYLVQVGAFRNIDYANELIEKLKPYYQYVYIEKEDNFNKVRIPGIETKKQGHAVMRELKEKLRLRSFLLRGYRE